MTKRHRSFSQFKSFTRCGEQYRLVRTLDLPKGPSAAMALGSAFHSNYEEWEIGGREWPLAERFSGHYDVKIKQQLEEQPNLNYWRKTAKVKEVETDIAIREQNGLLMSESYEEHCANSQWRVFTLGTQLGLEYSFDLDLGDFTFRGAIDSLLVWPSGNVTIRDLKTGVRETSGFQLGVYAYALRRAVVPVGVQYGEFYYTKDGKSEDYNLGRYTDIYVEDQLTKLDKMILNEEYLVNPGPQCYNCDVKDWCREMGHLYDA